MLASQRRARIADLVALEGAVRVSDLVLELGVSDMTVRRDIDQLAGKGVLERVHGGAVAAARGHSSDEPGFGAKSGLMKQQKQAIAAAAASLVEPGASIGISAGTTTFELARAVRDVPDLTVVTNSVPVAQLLHEGAGPRPTVVLTGGIRTPSDALVGPVAIGALRTLHVDVLFLGAHGVEAGAGLTTPNLVEAETNRALVACARRVCVLVDHTKFGMVGLSTFLDLADVDVLVTDDGVSQRARGTLSETVGELVVAGTGTNGGPGRRHSGSDRLNGGREQQRWRRRRPRT